jgi:spore maturation protein CgeB
VRLLLVSPAFHGYWRSIQSAFEARGHEVRTHLYDDFSGPRAKLRNKVRYELPERLGASGAARMTADVTATAVRVVRAWAPEAVVTVKGDALGTDFWDEMDRRRLPRVLWLYDELRRMAYTDEVLQRVGPIATYSPVDRQELSGRGIEARDLPLAFDPSLTPAAKRTGSEVVMVGARYPRREETMLELARTGVPVRAYGRQWSRHPADRLRTWQLHRPDLPAGRDLDRPRAYAVMADAAATLNIHGDQDGFTMRTFEACGVGAVQLIDRADVNHLYEPGRDLATFGSHEELVELCQRACSDAAWAAGLRRAGRRRTLAQHTFADRVAVLEEML